MEPVLRRHDALLQLTHFGRQRRLVTYCAGHAAQKRRHFRTGLGKAEDVVDKHQHVLAFDVTEVFRDRQGRQAHPQPGARRLVHLAEHHGNVGQNAALLHFEVQVVAFTGTLADAGEHREAAVLVRDVADQFLNKNRLADAGTAEQADLTAPGVRRQQVDDFNARLQNFVGGLHFRHRRCRPVNRVVAFGLDGALAVDGLAQHVHDPAQRASADRDRNRTGRCRTASMPRTRPSVDAIAMHRTASLPKCWATSSVKSILLFVGFVLNANGAVQLRQAVRPETRRRRPDPSPEARARPASRCRSSFVPPY